MTVYEIHPDAEEEYYEAIRYYAARSRTAAEKFIDEFRLVQELILLFPEIGVEDTPGVLRFSFRTLPHSIVYSIMDESIYIIAIIHHSREPGYWKERIL